MKQAAAAAKVEQKKETEALGPRLAQILQQSIAPWKRERLGEEEAQLAEIKRRPVRNRFDAAEAKRRLSIKPVKKSRTAKPKSATV